MNSPSLRALPAVCLLLGLAGCGRELPDRASVSWPAMGTLVTITAAGPDKDRLAEFAAEAKSTLSRLEAALSVYLPESDVSRLSANAGGESIPISEDTAELLALVRRYGELSGGAFDATVAPLVRLWGFSGGAKPAAIPGASDIASAMALVGYGDIVLQPASANSRPTARLARPGSRLDMGGIAKGYAVDVCFRALKAMGATSVIMDLGGNIRCIGAPSPRRPWRIGVRNPFDRSDVVGTLDLADGVAVATSGNYERFVMIDGERFSHIIDPRTGRPVKGMAGVTVVAQTAVEADALSTSLFVLGTYKGAELVERIPGCAAVFIPDWQPPRILTTARMKKIFTPGAAMKERVSAVSKATFPPRRGM